VGNSAGHAFISYVREDARDVDQLQRDLEAAGISVWRDTADLWPGQDWREMIRRAISDNAIVFIACFSSQSNARVKSYQREELTLAIEQLRLRDPEDPWLIPVRFDDCLVPDLNLGAGRTLNSIQRVDLFSDHRETQMTRLLATVRRLLGQPLSGPVNRAFASGPPAPTITVGSAYVQKCLKGINGITLADAQDILRNRGLACAWWRTTRNISPAEIAERLTAEELDLHLNSFGKEHPTRGGLVKDQTSFISLTAGTVERDRFLRRNIVHTARDTAMEFATDFGRAQGECFLFYCWVIVGLAPSVPVRSLAEDVRRLDTYTTYSPYQPDGEIVAKIEVPASQIEKFEHYECLTDGHGRLEFRLLGTYDNPNHVSPPDVGYYGGML
jgi:hypothetical protein